MSEKGIMVSDAATGEVVACRDAVETDESTNARIIQRVDVSKGKLWSTSRPATAHAVVTTGNVSRDASEYGIDSNIIDNALTVGDASTLVVVPEFMYNLTQSATITPLVLEKDDDVVVGALESKTVTMTVDETPYVCNGDLRDIGYFGYVDAATAIIAANRMPKTLIPDEPFVRFKMEFDKFISFPFTIPAAGTYTFNSVTRDDMGTDYYFVDMTFYETDGTPLTPTYVGADSGNMSKNGTTESYTFASAGTFLLCLDSDYHTADIDNCEIQIRTGSGVGRGAQHGYWTNIDSMHAVDHEEIQHDGDVVRFQLLDDLYKAIKINITEIATYAFTFQEAEMPVGDGDLTITIYQSDKTTVELAEVDADSPSVDYENFSHAFAATGVYWLVIREYSGTTTTVDVSITNSTGTETGTLINTPQASFDITDGDYGRCLADMQTWDVSGAYRIGLMVTDLDAGSNSSEVRLWGDII